MALTYEDIKPLFLAELQADARAMELWTMIEDGTATYAIASEYAAHVGDALATVLRQNAPLTDISEWDIEDLIPKSLGLDHEMVTGACQRVQEALNADAGVGIRFQAPVFDKDRCYGIVAELRDNPEFINIQDTFYDQLVNFSQNVVDESIRDNARVISGAGIRSTVIRTAEFKACPWCRAVAGRYNYEDVKQTGNDVWRRHENCRCTIDFVTEENGRRYVDRVNNQRRADSTLRPASEVTPTAPQPSGVQRIHNSDEEYLASLTPEQRRQVLEARAKLEEYYRTQRAR